MKKIVAALALIVLLYLPLGVNAQTLTSPSSSGISLTPAIEKLNLTKNQINTNFNITVSNNNTYPIVVTVSTSNFTALNTGGSVAFLNSSNTAHGLKQSLHPSLSEVPLPAKSSATIPISITNVSSLAPGGHYGAVIFRVVPLSYKSKGNSLSTNEELSVLVFLTTSSGGTQSVQLNPPNFGSIVTSLPTSLNLVLTNTGNTQVSPIGHVSITRASKVLAKGVINAESGLVLPLTSRLYNVNLVYAKKTNLPGIYHINAYYQASANSKQLSYTKTVFLINKSLIIAAILVALILLVFIIRRVGQNYTFYRPRQ